MYRLKQLLRFLRYAIAFFFLFKIYAESGIYTTIAFGLVYVWIEYTVYNKPSYRDPFDLISRPAE